MRKFILGTIFGGILLSGGWFAWGAIQSEVGLNLYSLQTQTWGKLRAIPLASAVGTSLIDSTTGVQVLNAPAVAATLWGTSGSAFIPLKVTNQQNGNFTGSNSALQTASAPTPFVYTAGAATTFCMASADDLSTTAVSLSPTFSSCMTDVRAFLHEYNGTTSNLTQNSYPQTTAGIVADATIGATVTMTGTPMSKYSMIIDRTAGAVDVVDVRLECSIDAVDFVQIAQSTSLVGEPVIITTADKPCSSMRFNVVTVGAANTLQIHLLATR